MFLSAWISCARTPSGAYALAPESAAFLVSTKPGFQGGLIRHTSEQLLPNWLHLNRVVATGTPAIAVNKQGPGSEFFEKFVNDIFPMSYNAAQELARIFDLRCDDGPVSVLDLAAGSGVWGIALAQSSTQVTVTAVDWPGVMPVTQATMRRSSDCGALQRSAKAICRRPTLAPVITWPRWGTFCTAKVRSAARRCSRRLSRRWLPAERSRLPSSW